MPCQGGHVKGLVRVISAPGGQKPLLQRSSTTVGKMPLSWNHGVQMSLLGNRNINAPTIKSMLSQISIHCRLVVKTEPTSRVEGFHAYPTPVARLESLPLLNRKAWGRRQMNYKSYSRKILTLGHYLPGSDLGTARLEKRSAVLTQN